MQNALKQATSAKLYAFSQNLRQQTSLDPAYLLHALPVYLHLTLPDYLLEVMSDKVSPPAVRNSTLAVRNKSSKQTKALKSHHLLN